MAHNPEGKPMTPPFGWCPTGAYRGTRQLFIMFLLLLGGKWLILVGFGGNVDCVSDWIWLTAGVDDKEEDGNTYGTKN
eukprot:4335667-Ditylum_brightwellii.AAC.1